MSDYITNDAFALLLQGEACNRMGCHILRMRRGPNGELPIEVSMDCMTQAFDYCRDAPERIPAGACESVDLYGPVSGQILVNRSEA